ncbi:MAG: flagellar protein FlaG [Thiotrichales bacterium]|nr:flagellar protein FlaG [Thiotrichales bacterium]
MTDVTNFSASVVDARMSSVSTNRMAVTSSALNTDAKAAMIPVATAAMLENAPPLQTGFSADAQNSQSEVDANLQRLNQQLEKLQNYLRFEKDSDSERMKILIKNSQNDEIIRQIPHETFLKIAKNISDFLATQTAGNENVQFPPGLLTHEQA